MNTATEIQESLNQLYQKINPYDLSWIDEVKDVLKIFMKFEKLQDFKRALEAVVEILEKDGMKKKEPEEKKLHEIKLNKIKGLLREIQKHEPDFLIESLKRKGYSLARINNSLREAINKEFLRILEQTRLGKRDAVIGMLIRNFMIRNIEIPPELIEALKPKNDINLFRASIYAFLSGFVISEE